MSLVSGAAVSLVFLTALLVLAWAHLLGERAVLAERAAVADGWLAALDRRDGELRRRELALRWAEGELR